MTNRDESLFAKLELDLGNVRLLVWGPVRRRRRTIRIEVVCEVDPVLPAKKKRQSCSGGKKRRTTHIGHRVQQRRLISR